MTGNGRLRVGGWIRGSDHPEYADDSGPLTGEIVAGAAPPDDRAEPVDAEPAGQTDPTDQDLTGVLVISPEAEDDGAYHGRRRVANRPRRAVLQRRASIAAVAVGVLLVGTSVLARLLGSGSEPDSQLAPPPTPPQAVPSQVSELGQRGAGPSASPVPATPSPADPVPAASFEAEAGEPGSHGQVVALDGASGGQVVRLSGNRNGTFVQFPGVTVAEAGRYDLTVFYFAEQARTAGVAVGDGSPEFVTFPSRSDAGTIGTVTLGVQLAAGGNTIAIATDGGAPLSVDRITVSG